MGRMRFINWPCTRLFCSYRQRSMPVRMRMFAFGTPVILPKLHGAIEQPKFASSTLATCHNHSSAHDLFQTFLNTFCWSRCKYRPALKFWTFWTLPRLQLKKFRGLDDHFENALDRICTCSHPRTPNSAGTLDHRKECPYARGVRWKL